ncbi:MAG TPA: peptidoglycan-binding protein [Bryobacteraceae bacterium]|jgi:peptidoglycan L-alanyl-D-glutamate endopeptidase CwlK|nr:peptidoglycan-binding protein [Bryobacteraceae bacterium]
MGSVLKLGNSGRGIVALQNALAAAGFSPGAIDGSFGLGTEAAVLGFQRSEGLVPDGSVGPNTAAALGLSAIPSVPSPIPSITVEIVFQMFPVTPIGNISAQLPVVLGSLVSTNLSDKLMVLMALSTIRAETESFEPINEGMSRFNTSPSGSPFDLYDNRKDLGNIGPPDGANFRGRGFVQLTGRANYTRYGRELGQDLIGSPTLANDPSIAAELLARFLKDRENSIREALADADLAAARRLVNGGKNGLDRFQNAFEVGNRLIPEQA